MGGELDADLIPFMPGIAGSIRRPRRQPASIAAVLAGREPKSRLKPGLICIVDTLDGGMRVFRNECFNIIDPRTKLFHGLRRFFDGHYLRTFR